MRLSNWPRNWVPATSAVKSSSWTSLSRSLAGTSPRAMRKAVPSATAVLPTPGSPIRQGLFLVRRERICTTRWISFSRPMMLSSWPFRALGGQIGAEVLDVLALLLVEALLFLLDPGAAKAAVFPGAAAQHLVTGRVAAPPGANSSSPLSVVGPGSSAGSSARWPLQLLVGDAHFLHNIVDRLDPQLLGAGPGRSPWGFWLSMPLETKTTAGRFLQRVQSNIKGSFLSLNSMPRRAASPGSCVPWWE